MENIKYEVHTHSAPAFGGTRKSNRTTLAIRAMGGTGNVLFEIASGSAIAARYTLDACLDSDSRWYPLASELAPMLNNVPTPCPKDVQERIATGDRIDLTNHCCVFEDFTVTPYGGNELSKAFNRLFHQSTKSLEDLFGPEEQRRGDVYYLNSHLQSWRYIRLGPRGTELRLKQQVIINARRRLEDLAPGSTHVAIHLRVMDASGPHHLYNFPGPKYFQA